MNSIDDRELASLCADGDATGWDELLARYDRRVMLVLLRAGAATTDLNDLRQDVYARLLADRGSALRGLRAERPGALGAFIAQVALRVAIDHGRSKGARARNQVDEEEALDLPASTATPEDETALRQRRAQFGRALLEASSGPLMQRDLIVLRAHFVDGLNPQEISGMGFGLSAKGVETLVRRARAHIQESLSRGLNPGLVKEK